MLVSTLTETLKSRFPGRGGDLVVQQTCTVHAVPRNLYMPENEGPELPAEPGYRDSACRLDIPDHS